MTGRWALAAALSLAGCFSAPPRPAPTSEGAPDAEALDTVVEASAEVDASAPPDDGADTPETGCTPGSPDPGDACRICQLGGGYAPCLVCREGACLEVSRLAGGQASTCALVATGEVYCWGDASSREIPGQTGDHRPPTRVWGPPREPAEDVDMGMEHVCVIAAGQVHCWGRNGAGQAGQISQSGLFGLPEVDAKYYVALPVRVPVSGAAELALASYESCARDHDGQVWCWGRALDGQGWGPLEDHGYAHSATPVLVEGLEADVLALGSLSACAIDAEGTLRCWGDGRCGELGVPGTREITEPITVPWAEPPPAQVYAGSEFFCATDATGERVWCWGCSVYGQTLRQETTYVRQPADRSTVFDEPVAHIAGAHVHACALMASGRVLCWGDGTRGNLARDNPTASALPVEVTGLGVSTHLAAGRYHACAADAAGVVRCWGDNQSGQSAPDDDEGRITTPAVVAAEPEPCGPMACALEDGGCLAMGAPHPERPCESCGASGVFERCFACRDDACVPVAGIDAGKDASCAWLDGGEVVCWGRRTHGLTGDSVEGVSPPLGVGGLPAELRQVRVGDAHACALSGEGQLYCWGRNAHAQVGAGLPEVVTSPTLVEGLGAVAAFDAGGRSTCAVTEAGALLCWGGALNGQGYQPDDSDYELWPTPTAIAGAQPSTTADAVQVAPYHGCVRTAEGSGLACWGSGAWGALGNGSGAQDSLVAAPIAAELGQGIGAFALATEAGCALGEDRASVWCWGAGPNAQNAAPDFLTDADPTPRPHLFEGAEVWALDMGWRYGCGLLEGGRVECWGRDSAGELGAAHDSRHPLPVPRLGLPPQRLLSTGHRHACAVDEHHVVRCWGSNAHGQLGGGLFTDRPPPEIVAVEWDGV